MHKEDMKQMRKMIGIIGLFILSVQSNYCLGQNESRIIYYNTGIGVRGAIVSSGLTIKHFIGDKTAVEGIVSPRYYGLTVTGLVERHIMAFNTKGCNWFFGLGAHAGSFSEKIYREGNPDREKVISFGPDVVGGLEYQFERVPFTVGLDLKPYLEVIHPEFVLDGAIAVRYLLLPNKYKLNGSHIKE